MNLKDKKEDLRRQAKLIRHSVNDKLAKSAEIHTNLAALNEFQQASSVLAYVSARSEVDTKSLIESLLQDQERVLAVPRVDGEQLQIVELRSKSELEMGSYSILEPKQAVVQDRSRHLSLAQIDICIMPGLAFDQKGNRLGYGGGFYDKMLAQFECPLLIALAFDSQVVEEIPVDELDKAVDLVVTPTRIIRCSKASP